MTKKTGTIPAGIVIYLHEDCDPLRLEFDRDLYVQEFVKTQFASVQIHIRVLKLLKAIEPYFRHLNVEDGGEWWETENISNLTEHFSRNQQAIEAELRKRQPLNRRTSFSCAAPTEVAEEELAVDCGHCINRLNVRVRSTSGCVAASDCEGPN